MFGLEVCLSPATGLFALCSARLLWLEGKDKGGTPRMVHRLALHCSIDTRAWTAEGTQLIRSEKITAADQKIGSMEQKNELNEKQLKMLQRKRSLAGAAQHLLPFSSQ